MNFFPILIIILILTISLSYSTPALIIRLLSLLGRSSGSNLGRSTYMTGSEWSLAQGARLAGLGTQTGRVISREAVGAAAKKGVKLGAEIGFGIGILELYRKLTDKSDNDLNSKNFPFLKCF